MQLMLINLAAKNTLNFVDLRSKMGAHFSASLLLLFFN